VGTGVLEIGIVHMAIGKVAETGGSRGETGGSRGETGGNLAEIEGSPAEVDNLAGLANPMSAMIRDLYFFCLVRLLFLCMDAGVIAPL
jgi:hypothetical protein